MSESRRGEPVNVGGAQGLRNSQFLFGIFSPARLGSTGSVSVLFSDS